jgi:hypothetical protein
MIRPFAALLLLTLLAACATADPGINARSERFKSARAAASPVILGMGY